MRLNNAIRVSIFASGAFLLFKLMPPPLAAQTYYHECIVEYDVDNEDGCPSCCSAYSGYTNLPFEVGIINSDRGTQSTLVELVNCGTAGSGCTPDMCPTSYVTLEYSDSTCCGSIGDSCNGAGLAQCCNGLICLSANFCGMCLQQGDTCSESQDCCSGYCNASNKCSDYCGGQPDDACLDDGDCCSYSCIGGYCE
jgi:hypothetical protein